LSEYQTNGTYVSTKAFGSTGWDDSYAVAVDTSGNVYMDGLFAGTVDFNAGLGIDNKTAINGNDIFLTSYDATGAYRWTDVIAGNG
jgi:hypothetical protein